MVAPQTRKCWPDETPDEVIARIREQHGDAVADLVAKDLLAEHERKRPIAEVVGHKEQVRPAIPRPKPRGMTPEEAASMRSHLWKQALDAKKGRRGYNRSGLPSSGAPRADR